MLTKNCLLLALVLSVVWSGTMRSGRVGAKTSIRVWSGPSQDNQKEA